MVGFSDASHAKNVLDLPITIDGQQFGLKTFNERKTTIKLEGIQPITPDAAIENALCQAIHPVRVTRITRCKTERIELHNITFQQLNGSSLPVCDCVSANRSAIQNSMEHFSILFHPGAGVCP